VTLPDPAESPVLSVEDAGALFGLGRSKAYSEARRFLESGGREGLPVISFGRTLRCPTATILRLLGLTDAQGHGDEIEVGGGP
jgi:hypothetical protein